MTIESDRVHRIARNLVDIDQQLVCILEFDTFKANQLPSVRAAIEAIRVQVAAAQQAITQLDGAEADALLSLERQERYENSEQYQRQQLHKRWVKDTWLEFQRVQRIGNGVLITDSYRELEKLSHTAGYGIHPMEVEAFVKAYVG